MDNVTHSLIGYALGRAAARTRERAEQRAAIWTSIAASNAPDLDFIAGLAASNTKLAYLAHHRGHTHTLLLAIPIGLLCAELFARVFGVRERAARLRVHGLGALAGLLHIGFDWLNNYGVHPFFPLDNRWYYGDAVFIIEPLLFAALLPLLALTGLSRAGRAAGWALCAAVLALVWGVSLVPLPSALIATFALAGQLFVTGIGARRRPERCAWLALGGALAVVALFAGTRALAHGAFTRAVREQAPDERIEQLVLTPAPANPLCWSALAVTSDLAETYRARLGYMSLSPARIAAAACRMAPRGPTTAPLAALPPEPDRVAQTGVAFDHVFEGKLERLRALAARSCEARILLQFARAPFWIDGPPAVIGDLRYDHEPELAFSELEPGGDCAGARVPWVPPLQSLLR